LIQYLISLWNIAKTCFSAFRMEQSKIYFYSLVCIIRVDTFLN
jgi:hypothetical protein